MTERADIQPTGRPIVIEAGGTRAVVGTVAAVLRSFSVDGVQLTEPIADGDHPRFANGIVLSPWPNRVGDGRWSLDGEAQQLAITEVDRRTSLHGLLRFADYEVRAQSPEAVTLGAVVPPQLGWPLLLDTRVEYRVVPGALEVVHGVTNLSGRRAPYATGAHPFLRVGDAPVESLVVTLHASTYFDVDERLLPVAELPVDGTHYDLRDGVPVGDVGGRLDTAFGGVRHGADGEIARLTDPASGGTLSLHQDASWGYVQIFAPTSYPDAAGAGRHAIAIEPMTAPPDALRSGEALVWLEPGESWTGGWSLRYSA
ncbi:MAG: aldose 1-epimerase family protein [Microbacteriaceae bacterium]|nr:aldose 1-epimerase family protein [Microbacteriaceae bacterium]